jgi:hypothetical protein
MTAGNASRFNGTGKPAQALKARQTTESPYNH